VKFFWLAGATDLATENWQIEGETSEGEGWGSPLISYSEAAAIDLAFNSI